MPFKSRKQERWAFANKKKFAKRWVKKYGSKQRKKRRRRRKKKR